MSYQVPEYLSTHRFSKYPSAFIKYLSAFTKCPIGSVSFHNDLCRVEQLSAIVNFSKLGPLFKSSEKSVELTESETEYVVRCVKHTYLRHIIFQVSEGEGW